MQRTYIAIDLKSYYASVECMERGLDPMTTNLVVADLNRTEKTICLAVSPSLKAYGIPGRARLFEVVERVKEVNAERRRKAGGNLFEKSCDARELAADPLRAVGYLVAPPQMAKYIQISTQIYNVYLKYIAPEDIHVYGVGGTDPCERRDEGIRSPPAPQHLREAGKDAGTGCEPSAAQCPENHLWQQNSQSPAEK